MTSKIECGIDLTKDWFSSNELELLNLKGMPKHRKWIIAKLVKSLENGGQRRKSTGKKGYEYNINSLPVDAQIDLHSRIKASSNIAEKLEQAKKELQNGVKDNKTLRNHKNLATAVNNQLTQSTNVVAKCQTLELAKPLTNIPSQKLVDYVAKASNTKNIRQSSSYIKKLNTAKARELILNRIEFLRVAGSFKSAALGYIQHYNNGFELELIEEVSIYKYIKSLSYVNLKRWKIAKDKQGYEELLPKEYNRESLFDKNEQIQGFLRDQLVNNPHTSLKIGYKLLTKELGNICSYSSYKNWARAYSEANEEFLTYINNQDKWRNKYQSAFGKADAHVKYLNQEWQIDSTIADIMLADNKRYNIVGLIDVFSRRAILHVSETSSASAVATCIIKGLIKFGKPDLIKTDNGKDYTSVRITEGLKALNIEQKLCTPRSPWEKPFIERFFGTFSHSLLTRMLGYIGNSVEIRKQIEAKKSLTERNKFMEGYLGGTNKLNLRFTPKELQNFCNAWLESDFYGLKEHEGLKGAKPIEFAQKHIADAKQTIITYEREDIAKLLIMLGERKERIVGKEGVKLDGGIYIHQNLGAFIGKVVIAIFDELDWGSVYVFDTQNKFICKAFDANRLGFSRKEVAMATKKQQKQNLKLIKEQTKLLNKEIKDDTLLIETMIKDREPEIIEVEAVEQLKHYQEEPKVTKDDTKDLMIQEEGE